MKIIEGMEQGTNEWLDFRRKHIGSSDASTVMGWNPWKTKRQLWEEKVLGWKLDFDQQAIDRMANGSAMEAIARMKYEGLVTNQVHPIVIESTEFPCLSASFASSQAMTKLMGPKRSSAYRSRSRVLTCSMSGVLVRALGNSGCV